MPTKPVDQFAGAMLGLMVGDAMGRPAKERTPAELEARPDIGEEMVGGFYTEDTEMMISVAEMLLTYARTDQNDLATRLGENLHPMRGYNPGALEVLYRLQQGMDWRDANTEVFESGSYGIGGTPRATPVGLLFHHDLDAAIEEADLQAEVTHSHPIGRAGAITMAVAVGLAVQRIPFGQAFHQLQETLSHAGVDDLTPYFDRIWKLLSEGEAPTPQAVVDVFGHNLTVQTCVPAALYCTQRYPESYAKAVGFACKLGGDADSIASIVGAIQGTFHGVNGIPKAWLAGLENEERGRDHALDLAQRLYAMWQERFGG
ncbi:MAG: ADP-ribosylglycohydrolase family protein [Anaerolineae bacterium]|nr:ADP-ribosylglycohydrolase family protein [Anaerolineae bacterium]